MADTPRDIAVGGEHDDIVYPAAVPFILVHLGCIAAIWSGVTWQAVTIGVVLYWLIVGMRHGQPLILTLRPALYFKYRHATHHTYTQHPELDPDIVPMPRSFGGYIKLVLGFSFWPKLVGTLYRGVFARFNADELSFIPQVELRRVGWGARILCALYALLLIGSVALGSWAALIYWLLPRILGEPVPVPLPAVPCGEGRPAPHSFSMSNTRNAPPYVVMRPDSTDPAGRLAVGFNRTMSTPGPLPLSLSTLGSGFPAHPNFQAAYAPAARASATGIITFRFAIVVSSCPAAYCNAVSRAPTASP